MTQAQLKARLPAYVSQSLEGPVGVARKTMPSRHLCDRLTPHKYVPYISTDITKSSYWSKK